MTARFLAAAALCLAVAAPAQAQFAKPEDAIKYRKGAFTVMGAHFGRLGAMAQGKAPFDAKAAAENAAIVVYMAKLPFAGFVEGSDKGETRAKPEIWKERAKFDEAAKNMQEATAKLAAATAGGNITLDQLKAAFGDTGKTCKACHDNYRKDQ
jgi:cytochrome c556